ncbi:hypothetical protein BGZ50_006043 [Haplosporangium sp. Z 11]|nr:hypothetical protein BGZ50_006043 [Haplosporangium sp. Z 11]
MSSTGTPPVVHQIPVDQIDFSPNISSEAENFFQTDADIARQAARQGMVNYDKGQAIKVASKVLDMCIGTRTKATSMTGGQTDESLNEGAQGQTVAVEDKALVGATLFLAESGHVARKLNLEGQERLVTGSWDKTIRIWDTETKECLATLKGHIDFVKALVVRTILIPDNANNNDSKKKRIGHELFSASVDGTILHWDLQTFEPFQGGAGGPWKGHVRGINDLCLVVEDDDEKNEGDTSGNMVDHGKEYLYSAGSDGTIRKWDIVRGQGRGGECVHVFSYHATTVYKLIVAANEIWSASADKTAQRLDLETKKVDMKLEHPDFVKSIALAGPYVITGGRQETVRVWSIATGKLIKDILGHFDEVSSMVVIGTTLLTASLDGTIRRWSLKEQDLVTLPPKDIVESLSGPSASSASDAMDRTAPSSSPARQSQSGADSKPNIMTEEEERELAELMGSDDDDD